MRESASEPRRRIIAQLPPQVPAVFRGWAAVRPARSMGQPPSTVGPRLPAARLQAIVAAVLPPPRSECYHDGVWACAA
jgi:hypothetical protein